MELELKHMGGMQFVAKTPSGHDVIIDASPEVGGANTGPRALELFLAGIGGCTGIDVALILKKMKVNYKDLRVKLETERKEDHPKAFTKINIKYYFKGKDLPMEKLERAVKLSQEKYCSASATVKGVAEVTYEIIVEEE
ncbi:osmotically inducible protein OsmC [Marinitoga sp. 1135]|uniref:Putative redox protein, regulator of disulfide bond formation n=1 Tax=Marinitoga piezophila (strain DSM 14283 / JCM 11233 / KA3) TaxID=443254 RepID=H2J4Q6_MARPK|nr:MULTISPECIES: OsmC family protein [Marinitoga]AEX85998.1 putative redox protein, regulator of disulfide bond formation [Marinitoga piezophila KA3]APT76420.1 osmotically inducible protein OsmC [Marinitoga sp. 1137]NUU96188.1 osmotically inducible protein OsmC [Marinitoga sp. 1135]NUU98096.1 osmotically inducible protein OsmC [Marinitoga sp. 1138]